MRFAVRPSGRSLPQRARAGIRGYRLSRAGALYGRYTYRLLSMPKARRRAESSPSPHRGKEGLFSVSGANISLSILRMERAVAFHAGLATG